MSFFILTATTTPGLLSTPTPGSRLLLIQNYNKQHESALRINAIVALKQKDNNEGFCVTKAIQ